MFQAPQFNQPNVAFTYGALFIKPTGAQLTHDTDLFFKMDPFVRFSNSGGARIQTNVCHGGGKKPHWNEQLELQVSSQDVISIEVWDHNTIGSNDPVAIGQIEVSKIVAMGGQYQDYVPLFYRGKPAGDLQCSWTYKTTQQNQGFQQQGFVQQGYPQQQQQQYQQSYPQQQYQQQSYPQQQYQQTTTFVQQQSYPQQQYPQQTTVVEEVFVQNQGGHHHHHPHHHQQQQVVVEEVIVNPGHHHQPQIVEEVIITQPQGHHHHHHHNNNW